MPSFEVSLTLPCQPETVFDYLLKPLNLLKISHPDMGLRFIDVPEVLELGSRMEFEITGYGPPQRLVHKIVEFERPRRITEKQVKGPLKHWVHEHIFEPVDSAAVTVIDRIEFKPPGGLVGIVVTESKIRTSLDQGFQHQHRELQKLFQQPNG